MTSRTHDVVAFATLVTVASLYPPDSLRVSTVILAMVGNIVGSLLPDIDQASNRLWDLLPGGNMIGKVLKNVFIAHRTLSHSFLGAGLFYWLLSWIMPILFNPTYVDIPIVVASIMIGYLSHLTIDGLTEEGLPLLFPIRMKFGFPPFKKWRIKTGGWAEKLVVFPGTVGYIVWFGFNHHDKLLHLIRVIR